MEPLYFEDESRVDDRDRQRSTPVNRLLRILELVDGVLLHRLSAALLSEHLTNEVRLIQLRLRLGLPTIARPQFESRVVSLHFSLLLQFVVVGAVRLGALALRRRAALLSLVVHGVVLELFPAVAAAAAVLEATPITIGLRVFAGFPTCALVGSVFVKMGRASVILPVVGVEAQVALVVLVAEGTPHRLKVKHVEVGVAFHLLQDGDAELGLSVSEPAEISVLTLIEAVWICLAKL